jgi:KRAB domain-containing zinc finger protein
VDESQPPAKRIKLTPAIQQQTPKVIKQEPEASPKKQPNEFPCRYCDKVFSRADTRDKHEQKHRDSSAFDCGFCSKHFKTQEALREHTQEAHRRDRRALGSDIKEEDPMVEYPCDEEHCGKVYTSPKSLRNHKKVKHSDIEEISCDICSSTFKTSEIAEHLKLHI